MKTYKKTLAGLLALIMVLALLPMSALADGTEGYQVSNLEISDVYPYGCRVEATTKAPTGTNYFICVQYSTSADFDITNTRHAKWGLTGTGKEGTNGIYIDNLKPGTTYYFRTVLTADVTSQTPLASSEVKTVSTPALVLTGTLDSGNTRQVSFTADQTQYFKFTPGKPMKSILTITSTGTENIPGIFSVCEFNETECYTGGSKSADNWAEYTFEPVPAKDSYIGITANTDCTVNLDFSLQELPTIQEGDNANLETRYTTFTAAEDGIYTFTTAGTTFAELCYANGTQLDFSSDVSGQTLSADLLAGELVELIVGSDGQYSVNVAKTAAEKNVRMAIGRSSDVRAASNPVEITIGGNNTARFFWGTENHFNRLVPETVKLSGSDGLDVSTDSAKDGTFIVEAAACGEYTLHVYGLDESGTEHEGDITINVVLPRYGFTSAFPVTSESYIDTAEGFRFSGDSGTIYYYSDFYNTQERVRALKFQISTDDATWNDVASRTVNSGNGQYVLECTINAADSCVGKLRVVDDIGEDVSGSIKYSANDYAPQVEIYTDQECSTPFSGVLSLADRPVYLYFKSSDPSKKLQSIGEPLKTQKLATVSWPGYDESSGIQKMSFSAKATYSQQKQLELTATFSGGESRKIYIPAVSTSEFWAKAVNTGEVCSGAEISSGYVNGLTYDIQLLSDTQECEDFTLVGCNEDGIVSAEKQGSILKLGYISAGRVNITLMRGDERLELYVTSTKSVQAGDWEINARNTLRNAKDKVSLKLDGDVALAQPLNINNNDVSLDLNGHTLSYSGTDDEIQVSSTGKLTINDSSEQQTGTIDAGSGGAIRVSSSANNSSYVGEFKQGVVVLNAGTLKGGCTVGIMQGAKMVINGGRITNHGNTCCITNYGVLIMTGGKIDCTTGTPIMNYCVRDDKLDATTSGYFEMTETAQLLSDDQGADSGPVVSGGFSAISSRCGTVNIGSGTVKADVSSGTAIVSSGDVKITGGKIIGATGVKLESFTNDDPTNPKTSYGTLNATGGTIAAATSVETECEENTKTVDEAVIQGAVDKPKCTMDLAVNAGAATLTVNCDYTCAAAKLLVAAYGSNGRLIKIDTITGGLLEGTSTYDVNVPAGAHTLKVFALDPTGNTPCGVQAQWQTA